MSVPEHATPNDEFAEERARRVAADREFELRKKSMAKAYLLWFFLGAFGAHRFYTKDTGMALGMLFTLGGLAIWTLIDGFFLAGRVNRMNEALRLEIYARNRVF